MRNLWRKLLRNLLRKLLPETFAETCAGPSLGATAGNGLYCVTLLSERTLAAGNFSSDALPLLQAGSADSKYRDSRFKIQGSEKKLLQSNLFGFKIQDLRLRKNFFNPTPLDSRFKAEGLRIQEVFSGS